MASIRVDLTCSDICTLITALKTCVRVDNECIRDTEGIDDELCDVFKASVVCETDLITRLEQVLA